MHLLIILFENILGEDTNPPEVKHRVELFCHTAPAIPEMAINTVAGLYPHPTAFWMQYSATSRVTLGTAVNPHLHGIILPSAPTPP